MCTRGSHVVFAAVVSTKWRGIPSIVVDGDTGFLIETKDCETLATKVRALATDENLRKRMGLAGRHRYESEFTRSRHLQTMSRVFLDVDCDSAERSLSV